MRGQVALPFILLISGIIIEITIAGSFITYFLSTSGLGERLSLRASTAAQSGLRDAMIRITRDKDFAASAQNYNLDVGNDAAAISVSRTVDSTLGIYIYTITSTGTASSRQRKLVATIIVNQRNGYIQLQSLIDTPVS
ncbi:MAG: hypothetical protein UY26_C0003G0299 [Candidatus Jorgensenbacteria bacterium GW2011_GWA1_48_13]|uniref:Uncharacterized protein n=2 Tax=Candidatus Joergenseniibacteriota TaxID=1752739 RepID=A0A0G1W7X9_9BACT|nr:MAG: hypothetical protein UY26_C0003G0299 [Candidatus Jorgensenbacteria bacterium GW2011_GWA1_48_13]KKU99242.1 MAG: hypothetical protein UY32_C0003G0012 [Candidatus Jorgensenbacteria bacterium GW2011_GWC1_48_8]KKW14813.1 MAG: hypothetical protein UY55_C0003G0029 [Candidatus Jorgensenbacteria bacterium GW2011_GWB1_50_10]